MPPNSNLIVRDQKEEETFQLKKVEVYDKRNLFSDGEPSGEKIIKTFARHSQKHSERKTFLNENFLIELNAKAAKKMFSELSPVASNTLKIPF